MSEQVKPTSVDKAKAAPKARIKKKAEQGKKFLKKHGLTLSVLLLAALAGGCLLLLKSGLSAGASALKDSYFTAYAAEKSAAYEALYQGAYERAESKYHVSNRVLISLEGLEKVERLEVLEAGHVELITENRDDNTGNITAWLEVTGKGTFIVDLKAAEVLLDAEHRHVLVRAPRPELTDVTITQAVRKLFKDDFRNGNYSEGVHLAVDQLNDATLRIQKSLMANQYIDQNARAAAVRSVSNLVKELNPDIPDLTVDVEFLDE